MSHGHERASEGRSRPDLPIADRVAPAARGRRRSGLVWQSVAGILLIAVLASGLAAAAVEQRRIDLESDLLARQAATAAARAAMLGTWLEGLVRLGHRVTRSELVQLYTGGAAGQADSEPAAWLIDQTPFVSQLLQDFVAQHDLLGASLVTPDGNVILTTGGLPELPALPEGLDRFSSFTVTPVYELIAPPGISRSLAFDLLLPLLAEPGQDAASGLGAGDALLVMTMPVLPRVAELLAADATHGPMPAAQLVQYPVDGAPALIDGTRRLGQLPPDLPVEVAAEAVSPRLFDHWRGTARAPAALISPVGGTPWSVLQTTDRSELVAAIDDFTRLAFGIAAAVILLLGGAFALFCRATARRRRREQVAHEQERAAEAARYQGLFLTLAENLSDGIGVKDAEGRYVLVSPGFGRALGSPAAAIVGRTDAEIRTGMSARPAADHDAAMAPPSLPEPAGSRLVTIPVERDGQATSMALVVARPAPSLPAQRPTVPRTSVEVERGRQARQLIDGAVAAMVRAVELRDPFLLGHTERVTELALAIGRELALSEDDLETVGLAARLCQIGKIFMADSILSKPGRHTAEETLIMGQHVRHALEVLEPVGLEAAVTDAVAHMHERLDGSGYPHGLKADRIGLHGRILGVADVFCARTAPRVYRDQITTGQALYHLAGNPQRYDAAVVSALVAVVAKGGGRARTALPAPAARMKPDAA